MPLDPRHFRNIVGRFLTGVTVVACELDGDVLAMTANSFTSLSLDPPLVLFCPGKQTRTGLAIDRIQQFSINVLREDQQAISTYFAGGWKQPEPPPFRFVHDLHHAIPRLEQSLAGLLCRRHQVHDGGDHWIVVGEVLALHEGPEPLHPLGFHLGRYTHLHKAGPVSVPDLSQPVEPGTPAGRVQP